LSTTIAAGTGVEVAVTLVVNVAFTVVSLFTVTVQVPVPLQPPPLHPENVDPLADTAVRATDVPAVTVSAQVLPHRIPAGELETEPEPVRATVSEALATVVDVAAPVTVREIVSPFALTFRLLAKLPAVAESRRTTILWLPPGASENEPPETMLNGVPTLADPVRLAVVAFCTVKDRSIAVPAGADPKSTAVDGLTVMSAWARPLTVCVHWLSSPPRSTAVTATKYVVPATRLATRDARTSPLLGAAVGEPTEKNDALGHGGGDVPR